MDGRNVGGITLEVLPGNVAQKWLGCMLTPYGSEQKSLDLTYHPWTFFFSSRLFAAIGSQGIVLLASFQTFIFENFADPLWALRRTLTGHLHGINSCTLGTNELNTLFASRGLRAGRKCVVVRIGNWHLLLFNAPLTTGYEEFCIGNPWGKGDSGVQNYAGRANWRCTVVTIGKWQH